MCSQIEVERESLIANVALVRLLAGMHQLVSLQLRVVKKSLATSSHRANICPLSMRDLMFSVRTLITKFFGAFIDRAGVSLILANAGLDGIRISIRYHVKR